MEQGPLQPQPFKEPRKSRQRRDLRAYERELMVSVKGTDQYGTFNYEAEPKPSSKVKRFVTAFRRLSYMFNEKRHGPEDNWYFVRDLKDQVQKGPKPTDIEEDDGLNSA